VSKMSAEILQIIGSSMEHLTAEEIYLLCKQRGVKCSIASIYRNLSFLAEHGHIHKLSFPGEADRYDKTVLPHDHLICEKCKHVSDINIDNLKQLLERQIGTEIDYYELSMHYVCPKCKGQ